jgi:polar amino acid transport system substrate-binding protein
MMIFGRKPDQSIFRTILMACLVMGSMKAAPAESQTVSSAEAAKKLAELNWYTEEYPPFNYKGDGGRLSGIAVDILSAAFLDLGVKRDASRIPITPWNRSYKFIQKKPGTALFSMTYTAERLKIMKIVGPSVGNNISVIAPVKNRIRALTIEDLGDFTIGVVRDDIGHQLIRSTAFSSDAVVKKNSLKQLIYLLGQGRIDAIAYSVPVFHYTLKQRGVDLSAYEEVLVLKEGQLGYAFHQSTDPAILLHLQKSIDKLKADGTIKAIIRSYGN